MLDPAGENYLAFAYSGTPVDEPANNETTFGIHDRVGHWVHDFAPAQASLFRTWASGSSAGKDPASTTALTTSLTIPTTVQTQLSTTLQTTVIKPTAAVPALPIPSSCAGIKAPRFELGVADGWKWTKIAGGMTRPRQILLDSEGNLLVIQSGIGLTAHMLGTNGCISSSKTLISIPSLNHGLALTPDGKTLYVSSSTTAWQYSYDAKAIAVTNQAVVVKGMYQGGHPTRTLMIPPKYPNLLVVSQGSNANFDMESLNMATARAVVKVFDLSKVPSGGYTYNTQGWFLGYGLRNDVAIVIDGNSM
jgi:glucose/arabinose dehydrogenase